MEVLTSNFVVNYVPLIAGILLGICYIPQLLKTYRTKNVEGFSVMFWSLLVIALGCFVINALSLLALGSGSYGYLIAELFNLTLASLMLVMVVKYRNYTHTEFEPSKTMRIPCPAEEERLQKAGYAEFER